MSTASPAVPVRPMRDQLAGARVLIVDDLEPNISLLCAILSRSGIVKIFTEMDSRKVLGRLAEVDPDLIILDLHMPHLNGLAVLEQIRTFASSEYLPVLVVTADTTLGASEQALRAGAQDFITKPFNNTELLLRSRNLLRSRFQYTKLRSSMARARDAQALEQLRLTRALGVEQAAIVELRLTDGFKDVLLQTIGHDLRNPLAAVLILVGLLAADADDTQPLPAEMKSSILGKVETAIRKMDRVLGDLLESDPMRNGERTYLCDVGDLIERVLTDPDLIGPDHEVFTAIESAMAMVDPVHVERMVENLLTNARKHLPPDVPIWISTTNQDDGVLISVEDAGPGVPPAIADTIFEPFRRGDDPQSDGHGLGLSLVSRFAQFHGGRAWVEERPGGGAAFRVFLPSHLPE